jgi:putative methyltransferase (TIGR04325 family)
VTQTIRTALKNTARRVLPENIRKFIHTLLGHREPIRVRYEVLPEWPPGDIRSTWRANATSKRLKSGLETFDLKTARETPERSFSSPVVHDNLNLLSRIPGQKIDLLDYGCGNGIYKFILSAYPATSNWNYTGADINADLVQFCRSQHSDTRFEELFENKPFPFENEEFDVVLASGVLQCIQNYQAVLRELVRVSKDYVVVSRIPIFAADPAILLQHVQHYEEKEQEYHPIHVFNDKRFEAELNEL